MASSDKLLEGKIMETGNRLQLASSVHELLPILDKIESLLSRVDQLPSQTMLSALNTTRAALVSRKLLRHPDLDVKVSVASCISEITRITAPEAPYEDDLMKEAFQLIVQAFEKLDDLDSRSYIKRVSILETVAKVRSCVVMLDLECDALILEMFHHFLRTIRPAHPESIFSSMETIMTLVLEESEEISSDLVSCLVNSVKRDSKDILSISHKLAEKVISNSAVKLNPYLLELVRSKDSSREFSDSMRLVCTKGPDDVGQIVVNASSECLVDVNKLSERTLSDELHQEPEAVYPERVATAAGKSLKSTTSNGTAQTADMDSVVEPASSCLENHSGRESVNLASDREDFENLDSVSVKLEDVPNRNAKGKSKKTTLVPAKYKDNLSRNVSDNGARSISSRKGVQDGSSDDGSSGRETEPEFLNSGNDTQPAASAGNGTISDALPTNNQTSEQYPKDELQPKDALSKDDSDDSGNAEGKDVKHSSEKLHGYASEDGGTKGKAKKTCSSSGRPAPHPKQKDSSGRYSKDALHPRDSLSKDDSSDAEGKGVKHSSEKLHKHSFEDGHTKQKAKKADCSSRWPAPRSKQKDSSNQYSKGAVQPRNAPSKDDSDASGDAEGNDVDHSSEKLHGHASEDGDIKEKVKKAGSSNRRPAPRSKQDSSNQYSEDALQPRYALSKDNSDDSGVAEGKDAERSSDNLHGHVSEDEDTKGKAKKTGRSSRRRFKHDSSNQYSKVALQSRDALLNDNSDDLGDAKMKYVEHSSEKLNEHASEDGDTKGKAKKSGSSRRPAPSSKKDSSNQYSKDALQHRDAISKEDSDDSGDAEGKVAEHSSENLHGHAEDEDTKGKAKKAGSYSRRPAPHSKLKDSSKKCSKDALQPIDALLRDDSDDPGDAEGKYVEVEHSSEKLHGHVSEDGDTNVKAKKSGNSRRPAPGSKQDSSNQYSKYAVQPRDALSNYDSDDSLVAEGEDVEHSVEKLHGYVSEDEDTPVFINSMEAIVKKKKGSGKKTTLQAGDKGSVYINSTEVKGSSGKVSGRRSSSVRHKSKPKTPKTKPVLDKESLQDPNSEVSGMFDGVDEYGEDIVGSEIEVWWPDDKQFYYGVVDCFYPDSKKHKIIYTDGDVEILYLKDERFNFIFSEDERKKKRKGVQIPDSMETKSDSDANPRASPKNENHGLVPKKKQKAVEKDDTPISTSKPRISSTEKEATPIISSKLENSSDKLKDDSENLKGTKGRMSKGGTPIPKSGNKIKDDADSNGPSKRKSKFDAGSEEAQGGGTPAIVNKRHQKGGSPLVPTSSQ